MLNEIRCKLPLEEAKHTFSPFEVESNYERETHRNQMMLMNVKQYEMVAIEPGSVIETI